MFVQRVSDAASYMLSTKIPCILKMVLLDVIFFMQEHSRSYLLKGSLK